MAGGGSSSTGHRGSWQNFYVWQTIDYRQSRGKRGRHVINTSSSIPRDIGSCIGRMVNRRMIRTTLRLLLCAIYFVAGVIHLASPLPFLSIMPDWVPAPELVVLLTGVAEIFGAIGLAQSFSVPLRRAAALGLALYAICVFPANINHFILDMAKPDHGLGLGYHVPRMFAQPLVVWLAVWVGGVTDWPFKAGHR